MSESQTPSGDSDTRCGFVALLGAPNVGKSTLLNALVGSKVAIVSPKPQTTRSRVTGIVMEGQAQLIFVDLPGVFQPRRRFDRAMVASAWQGTADADITCVVVDATRPDGGETLGIVERLKKSSRRAVLVLNKIDLVSRETLLPAVAAFDQDGIFDATYLVSASTGDGVADLRKALAANVPTSPHLFPEDQLTDLPQRLLAAEITREQVFLQLHEEVPYSVAVETENWTERPDGSVRIDQVIYVMRDGQKAIVLGKGGSRIKTLGQSSRKELEAVLDRRVHLFLYVKVRQNWAEDPGQFREWGLDYNV